MALTRGWTLIPWGPYILATLSNEDKNFDTMRGLNYRRWEKFALVSTHVN